MILFLVFILVTPFNTYASPNIKKISSVNAHEGPVCVESQNRLYFSTLPNYQKAHNEIKYLDLKTNQVYPFITDANMANGMIYDKNHHALIVAEQGSRKKKGGIYQYDLTNKKQQIIMNQFQNKDFNSPNKVLMMNKNWLIFSDPNYGYFQGFKDKAKLKNGLYAYHIPSKKLQLISADFSMPHGLAYDFKHKDLYLSDTAALNGKDPYDIKKSHHIYKIHIDGKIISTPKLLTAVTPGIPDGMIFLNNKLIVATGSGIQVFTPKGYKIKDIKLNKGAINLTKCHQSLIITAPDGLYSITNMI